MPIAFMHIQMKQSTIDIDVMCFSIKREIFIFLSDTLKLLYQFITFSRAMYVMTKQVDINGRGEVSYLRTVNMIFGVRLRAPALTTR